MDAASVDAANFLLLSHDFSEGFENSSKVSTFRFRPKNYKASNFDGAKYVRNRNSPKSNEISSIFKNFGEINITGYTVNC